jgi:solute carrier family 25, member 44
MSAITTIKSDSTHPNISDIQWHMIDKNKYFPLTTANMVTIRTILYPLTLVRTRLQVQTRGSLYTGTFNALQTVVKYEGFLALYKGYWINSFQMFPHVLYIGSYEVN